MKGSVGAWISALEKLKAGKGVGVNLTIGTLITGDEEWAAVNGSDKVLAWMKANGKIPTLYCRGTVVAGLSRNAYQNRPTRFAGRVSGGKGNAGTPGL